jgi:hypothetical protein
VSEHNPPTGTSTARIRATSSSATAQNQGAARSWASRAAGRSRSRGSVEAPPVQARSTAALGGACGSTSSSIVRIGPENVCRAETTKPGVSERWAILGLSPCGRTSAATRTVPERVSCLPSLPLVVILPERAIQLVAEGERDLGRSRARAHDADGRQHDQQRVNDPLLGCAVRPRFFNAGYEGRRGSIDSDKDGRSCERAGSFDRARSPPWRGLVAMR